MTLFTGECKSCAKREKKETDRKRDRERDESVQGDEKIERCADRTSKHFVRILFSYIFYQNSNVSAFILLYKGVRSYLHLIPNLQNRYLSYITNSKENSRISFVMNTMKTFEESSRIITKHVIVRNYCLFYLLLQIDVRYRRVSFFIHRLFQLTRSRGTE